MSVEGYLWQRLHLEPLQQNYQHVPLVKHGSKWWVTFHSCINMTVQQIRGHWVPGNPNTIYSPVLGENASQRVPNKDNFNLFFNRIPPSIPPSRTMWAYEEEKVNEHSPNQTKPPCTRHYAKCFMHPVIYL